MTQPSLALHVAQLGTLLLRHPSAASGPHPAAASGPIDLALFVAQLGTLLLVAITLGSLARRVRLPAIVGYLLAGVLLGPTVLGAAFPAAYATLFPANDPVKGVRMDFLQVGLLLFIFLVGLEVDLGLVRQRLRTVISTSAFGVAIPFAAGFASVLLFPNLWHAPMPDQKLALPFMMGVALAISALPVIAAILADLGLIRTEVGRIILSAAVIDDLCGWLGFALIAGAFTSAGHTSRPVWQIVVIVCGAFALTLTLGRSVASRAKGWLERHTEHALLTLGLILGITLLAAALMEGVGAHAFFGALLVGIALSDVNKQFFEPLERVVRSFFVPLYFGAVGINLNFRTNFDLLLVVVVLLLACAGKLVGAFIGARVGGCSPRSSLAIASGMNARGAVEILLATLALQAGLVTGRIFVAIIVMAVVTSILAGSLLQAILHVEPLAKLVKAVVPILQRIDTHGRPVAEIEIGPRLTIGRGPSNQLWLPDDELVSLDHAIIRRTDGRFVLEDLGSTNGTLIWRNLGWREVTLEDIHDGDIIVIGRNVFRFSLGAGSEA